MSRGETSLRLPKMLLPAPSSISALGSGAPIATPVLLLILSHAFLSRLRSPALQSQSRRVKPKPCPGGSGSYESGVYSLREGLTHTCKVNVGSTDSFDEQDLAFA